MHVSLNIQMSSRLFWFLFFPVMTWLTRAFDDQIWLTSLAFPPGRWYLFICLVTFSSSAAHYYFFFTPTGRILGNSLLPISTCHFLPRAYGREYHTLHLLLSHVIEIHLKFNESRLGIGNKTRYWKSPGAKLSKCSIDKLRRYRLCSSVELNICSRGVY